MKRYLLLLFVLCTLSSCTKVLLGWFGVKNPKPLTGQQIERYAAKYGADTKRLYQFDTAFAHVWKDTLIAGEPDEKKMKDRHKMVSQPLQYWLFDAEGRHLNYTANCYFKMNANGLNIRKGFDAFPPVTEGPVDSAITGNLFFPYLNPVGVTATLTTYADYTCIVIWGRFMGRNSRRLIKAANKSLQHKGQNKVNVYYVNNDVMFANMEKKKLTQ